MLDETRPTPPLIGYIPPVQLIMHHVWLSPKTEQRTRCLTLLLKRSVQDAAWKKTPQRFPEWETTTMTPPKKSSTIWPLQQKYEIYVVFMNFKSETSCVPSISSISNLLVWTVLVFCICTDLFAPKLWINPLCWIFYCLTSVCLSVSLGSWSSQLQRWMNGNYSQWCHTYVSYMRPFTRQTFWLTQWRKHRWDWQRCSKSQQEKVELRGLKTHWNPFKRVRGSLKLA